MGKIRSSYPSMDGSSISMNAVIVGYYLPEVVGGMVVSSGCSGCSLLWLPVLVFLAGRAHITLERIKQTMVRIH